MSFLASALILAGAVLAFGGAALLAQATNVLLEWVESVTKEMNAS